jgi:hypothetical protein
MEEARRPSKNTTTIVAKNNIHASQGRFSVIFKIELILSGFYLLLIYFFNQLGTGLSGSGTLAFGTLERLFTLPCGTSRWHSQHLRPVM